MPKQQAETLVAELTAAIEILVDASDRSTPGIYIVLTSSGAVYLADTRNPDAAPAVTRYAGGAAPALHDMQPVPGVHGFSFSATTGRGVMLWWKDNPSEYDDPSLIYGGTTRSTSRVLLVARLRDETRAGQERIVVLLHALIDKLRDPGLDYSSLIARLWSAG